MHNPLNSLAYNSEIRCQKIQPINVRLCLCNAIDHKYINDYISSVKEIADSIQVLVDSIDTEKISQDDASIAKKQSENLHAKLVKNTGPWQQSKKIEEIDNNLTKALNELEICLTRIHDYPDERKFAHVTYSFAHFYVGQWFEETKK